MNHTRNFASVALIVLAFSTPISSSSAQLPGADSSFRWSAQVDPGVQLAVRTLYGTVTVESADVDSVTVRAVKSWRTGDPNVVSLVVSRSGKDDGNILICGIWKSATLDCAETNYAVNNNGRNDTRLDITVTVPRRMDVTAESINGTVMIAGVGGIVSGSTVNGSVSIAVDPATDADVIISTFNGSFHSDLPLAVEGRLKGRGTTRAKLGAGGRNIYFSSVNGELRLLRKSTAP